MIFVFDVLFPTLPVLLFVSSKFQTTMLSLTLSLKKIVHQDNSTSRKGKISKGKIIDYFGLDDFFLQPYILYVSFWHLFGFQMFAYWKNDCCKEKIIGFGEENRCLWVPNYAAYSIGMDFGSKVCTPVTDCYRPNTLLTTDSKAGSPVHAIHHLTAHTSPGTSQYKTLKMHSNERV